MYAALEAARAGASVILADRSLIGRGGATVMAQMTVAAALGEQTPDHWEHHLADTLAAGRDLCDERLAALVCEDGPRRIREMDAWKVGWARENDHIKQAQAPGHDRPRCVYVDFLSTGPAVSRTLRTQLNCASGIRRIGDLVIVDIAVQDGEACGATALHLSTGRTVTLAAKAVVIATGGLTRLYRRNSASSNMGGDGYALALRAGAELVDMEFVQFFPIGHLAPRLVGMDPIMWDPFRYKLGGKLLNVEMREFEEDYATRDARNDGRYVLTRDHATYAISKEVEAGRGSPAGGAYLSFQHVLAAEIRRAFGPVVDRLAANGIDLARQPVEVAPIAHYHMGGIRVDDTLQTRVPGLYACGEAVGGANGANRLSGNAITEAFVFGARAGRNAAQRALGSPAAGPTDAFRPAIDLLSSATRRDGPNTAAAVAELQTLMAEKVGPFRTHDRLEAAVDGLMRLRRDLGEVPLSSTDGFDPVLIDWLDLRNMLLVAQTVAAAAIGRTESRGAHQREDYPGLDDSWRVNQIIALRGEALDIVRTAPLAGRVAA
ncbi:FAD-binding protein [Bradyrhizobium elkanii]|uniref:FAD-binding protein n=2 Tax=Nitrobacteraceae TaxID=41294 RepID=UPI001AEC8B61|nr:FAD-binding protein [Bradyrhizobium elkanii]MCS3451206.1 succinate dehydrogenase/fumarate reductase flavoprotein subunit [Bradyrhizobium elkanii]MCS3566771.1 succinate dehydrogenase/fumarate reductase flavoprotein subunit [Bradyrhizobium elkanii]MCW2152505.1 succinate dehydrogenase/fumarate reductase flavoprotein subunit [Bradyrhizobium elkanii]MCW2376235.1 succinate dehydrogenase/fumarate reductase flavoprotein subunit [Bradyrhizobium elkanii]WLC12183.1 FAD-binding protein [Bradyrhizobium 